MKLGYLTLLVADIPYWIASMIKTGKLISKHSEHSEPTTTSEMINHFDENVNAAKQAFQDLAMEDLPKPLF
jgi:hypothetical protein